MGNKSKRLAKAVQQQPQKVDPRRSSNETVIIQEKHTSTTHSGPLPDPETLARYEQLNPGMIERIMSMAEQEASHRRSIESRLVDSHVEQSIKYVNTHSRGQILGFLVFLVAIACGTAMVLMGHPTAGGVVSSLNVVGVAALLVTGKRARTPEAKNVPDPTDTDQADDA